MSETWEILTTVSVKFAASEDPALFLMMLSCLMKLKQFGIRLVLALPIVMPQNKKSIWRQDFVSYINVLINVLVVKSKNTEFSLLLLETFRNHHLVTRLCLHWPSLRWSRSARKSHGQFWPRPIKAVFLLPSSFKSMFSTKNCERVMGTRKTSHLEILRQLSDVYLQGIDGFQECQTYQGPAPSLHKTDRERCECTWEPWQWVCWIKVCTTNCKHPNAMFHSLDSATAATNSRKSLWLQKTLS